jgi:hypothetical protein
MQLVVRGNARLRYLPVLSIALLGLAALASCQLLQAGFPVSGVVRDASGNPVADAYVYIEGSGLDAAITSASGSYSFPSVPSGTFRITARKTGYAFIPVPKVDDDMEDSAVLALYRQGRSDADLLAVPANEVTIPMVQGRGLISPLLGQRVYALTGVVTRITRRAPHILYDTIENDGSTSPQWVNEDGFYIEAIGEDKDGDPLTSDGIFVYTHNDAYMDSHWLNTCPADIAVGDIVTVAGVVFEHRPVDRFGSTEGKLTMTWITEPVVGYYLYNGVKQNIAAAAGAFPAGHKYFNARFPGGVFLTYQSSPALPAGCTEYRTMPWEDYGPLSLLRAIRILESVESMFVRVNDPLATSCTYYNLTGILAENGYLGGTNTLATGANSGGTANKDLNLTWKGIHINGGSDASMDFNTEILFVDYQKPEWKTFDTIPQVGDRISASGAAPSHTNWVLHGVMEYTADGVYMIRPHQTSGCVSSGGGIPIQNWDYTAAITTPNMKDLGASNRTTIRNWRIGSGADNRFKATADAAWTTDANHIRYGSFNIENFEAQGLMYGKVGDIADIMVYNMGLPDVITVIEMGDDKESVIVYENQNNSYSIPDGETGAVANFVEIIKNIKAKSSIDYDFREIAPEELVDGGEPGTNIRVGFLFRKDRVKFVDRGVATNTYADVVDGLGNLMSRSFWPTNYPSGVATMLARSSTAVAPDAYGFPTLTQSPGRIQAYALRSSRKPLVGEFIFEATGNFTGPNAVRFFAIAAHLGSKRGDTPLYGDTQPPLFGSDASRMQQAAAVKLLVDQIMALDPNALIFVAGDMNDFEFGPSQQVLTGKREGNQVLFSPFEEFMPPAERFSYVFRGNMQMIDHIFVSRRIHQLTVADGASLGNYRAWAFISHIDSVFSKNNHIQTSDHDALVVRVKVR